MNMYLQLAVLGACVALALSQANFEERRLEAANQVLQNSRNLQAALDQAAAPLNNDFSTQAADVQAAIDDLEVLKSETLGVDRDVYRNVLDNLKDAKKIKKSYDAIPRTVRKVNKLFNDVEGSSDDIDGTT